MSIAENLRRDADDALNNGGMYYSGEYLDSIAKKVEEVEAENEKLRHENEALRADATHWELGNCPSCKNVADLQEALDENARLRELVKNMHGWLVVNYEKSYVIPLNGLNDIERDMRELGIEMEP